MRGTRSLAVLLAGAALAALALGAAGCSDPFKDLEAASVQGYLAADLLPADREVGSWRRTGKAGEVRKLHSGDFRQAFGEEAYARTKPWGLGDCASAVYRLGETGRTVTVEIYDLTKAKGAFDVYSLIREKALAGEKPTAKVTKAGVQGLLFWDMQYQDLSSGQPKIPHTMFMEPGTLVPLRRGVLLTWAERFIVKLTHYGGVSAIQPGDDAGAEAALLAFAGAVTAKLKQPFDLPEVYVLQIPGEAANSERCEPGRLFGRSELPGGVTARWQGRTGSGTLFISASESAGDAAARFERLRRAADGQLTADFANGLFTGSLPRIGPVACFRHGKAVVGLLGAAELEERMAAVEEVRKRCAGEGAAPAGKPEASKP